MSEPWPFTAATLPDIVQVEDGQIVLAVGNGRTGARLTMPPAAALELAARLKTTALSLDTGCLAYTQGGTRCSLEKGHAGHHVTGTGGWFRRDGDFERPLEAKR